MLQQTYHMKRVHLCTSIPCSTGSAKPLLFPQSSALSSHLQFQPVCFRPRTADGHLPSGQHPPDEELAESSTFSTSFQPNHSLFLKRSFSTTKNITGCHSKTLSKELCTSLIGRLKRGEIAGSCHDFQSTLLFPTLIVSKKLCT